ncbi:MAG: electron transfer flavoprotein subunit alpha/FixB family protein, partial [Acidimicrobiaceae bacterium]|nr:electron transfer flavoprotein subunit alpha/FixB family protein [Acidimicrobiaceae bacterium]
LRELLGAAGLLAAEINGSTAVLLPDSIGASSAGPVIDAEFLAAYGADHIVHLAGAVAEEDVAAASAIWAADRLPWAILAPGTSAGREVASRVAADLGAGLAGDAVEFDVQDGRLVAWKSAFGGQLIVAVHTRTPVQLATVRAGVLPTPEALEPGRRKIPAEEHIEVSPRGRLRVIARRRDDDIDVLADAATVIAVGQGVDPADYPKLDPLLRLLDAELACTRKVTDNGWMPHARQIGITGRSISPRLFVMIGASGKFNHTVGIRGALSVLAITNDPEAPAWEHADAGIVGDWQEVLPLLLAEIESLDA